MKSMSKKLKILFYVANVFFDAGEPGECARTFLGSYRLEKLSKSHGATDKSITIGIPIQIGICYCTPLHLHAELLLNSAEKTTS